MKKKENLRECKYCKRLFDASRERPRPQNGNFCSYGCMMMYESMMVRMGLKERRKL